MKTSHIDIEMSDGTVHEDVRILAQDRLALERTSRAKGWKFGQPDSTHMYDQQVFLGWHALKRNGEYAGTFEEFRDRDHIDSTLKHGEAVLGDPTPPAATAG